MKKLRLILTLDYDADPAHYGTDDIDKMVKIDQVGFDNDFSIVLDMIERRDVQIQVMPAPSKGETE